MKRSRLTATLVAALALVAPQFASAALIVTASSSTTEFSVRSVGAGTETAIFGSRGELLSPGRGFPSISAAPIGAGQTISGAIAPTSLVATANRDVINPIGEFGTASATLAARGSTSVIGNSTSGAGVFWNPAFASDLGFTEGHVATVMISEASATFLNNGPLSVTGTPGAVLSVRATIANDFGGSFAAAALTGSITNHATGITTEFARIIAAGNGTFSGDTLIDFASAPTSSFTPGADNLSFTAYGLSRLSPTTIPLNGTVTVRGTLTLIGDPASIEVFDPGLIDLEGIEFGLFSSAVDLAAIPEPATWIGLSTGLMTLGLARSRRLLRSARRSPC